MRNVSVCTVFGVLAVVAGSCCLPLGQLLAETAEGKHSLQDDQMARAITPASLSPTLIAAAPFAPRWMTPLQ